MPQDQIFDAEDLEYDHKSQMMQQAKERKAKEKIEPEKDENEEELATEIKVEENASSNIDNPYLAATKLPNKKEEMDFT